MPGEAQRLGLYNRLVEVLGQEHADAVMDTLATKADLERLRIELIAEMHKVAGQQTRTMVWALVALTGIYSGINLMIFG